MPKMRTQPKMPALLTASEVARAFRVEPSTVYRWIRAGTVESVKIAGTVRVPVRALGESPGALLNTPMEKSDEVASD